MLTDVSEQVTWSDLRGRPRRLTPAKWRLFFLDMLNREADLIPNADGTGYVNIGQSSSDLSAVEMSDVIELIYKFGAERDVVFTDTNSATAEGYGAGHQRANEETSMTDQPDEPEVDEIEGADDAADADNEAAEDEDGAGEGEAA